MTDKNIDSTYINSHYFEPDGEGERNKRILKDIILKIRKEYGSDIIYDIFRLNALLMDLVPGMVRERKLIINALKEGILTQLIRGFDEKEPKDEVIQKCISLLISEMFITEAASRYAVDVIADSMIPDISVENKSSSKERQLIKGEKVFTKVVTKNDLFAHVSIGYKAFAFNYGIEEIDIPQNIRKIYPKAMKECRALKTVRITRGTEEIGRNIFDGCVNLKNIIIENNPYYSVDNGFFIDNKNGTLLRYINDEKNCITLPDGIKVIGKRSFDFCGAEKIKIPESVEKIEEDAFYNTMNLQYIITGENNKFFRSCDGVLYSRDGMELIFYPRGRKDSVYYIEHGAVKIGRKAFKNAILLSSIVFTDTLKEIGESAFENCIGIENIILPRSIELIGERAFRYCERISSIVLPQGIKSIGACAFQGCRSLNSLSVPRSVREIGNMAFNGCSSLKKVIVQENVSFIGDGVFDGCPDIEVAIKNNEYVVKYCKIHRIKYTSV